MSRAERGPRRGAARLPVAALAALMFATAPAQTPCAAASPSAGPLVIAHRAGTADYPENTLLAVRKAVEAGVDGVWLTVQASADGTPVLYRPEDLAALTDGAGPVDEKTEAELVELNAGWNFSPDGGEGRPYRDRPTPIPTLEAAIKATPPALLLFLDLKQEPAGPLVSAVARVLRASGATARAVVYSTQADITEAAAREPGLRVAESRDATRQRLLDVALAHTCSPAPVPGSWAGFELRRDLAVTEQFTLGVGTSQVMAELWSPESVACFTSRGDVRTIAFAVNSRDDYALAAKDGLDAVLVDSPAAARGWRAR